MARLLRSFSRFVLRGKAGMGWLTTLFFLSLLPSHEASANVTGQLLFTDVNGAAVANYRSGDGVYIKVVDNDANADPAVVDTVTVRITSPSEDTGTRAIATAPVPGGSNKGNGSLTNVSTGYATRSETWTVSCVSASPVTFQVSGSVSGQQTKQYGLAGNGPYVSDDEQVSFRMTQGSAVFAVGDSFTFTTTAATVVSEVVTLTETGPNTGVFTGSIALRETGGAVTGDALLQVTRGDRITAFYDDPVGDWGAPVEIRQTALYGATTVSGSIATNTTWSKNQSPYLVTGDVTVANGVTLTVGEGVSVLFLANSDDRASGDQPTDSEILVNGTLLVAGTAASPVLFTSSASSPQTGDWGGIRITGPGSGSFRYATVEYSGYGISSYSSSQPLSVENCITRNNGNYGIQLQWGSSSILNNQLTDNIYLRWPSDVIMAGNTITGAVRLESLQNGSTSITNNTISKGYIQLSYDSAISPVISGNSVTDGPSGGIVISNYTSTVQPVISNNILTGNNGGIYTYGKVAPTITGNTVSRNFGVGIVVSYNDSNGNGTFMVTGNTIINNGSDGIGIYNYAKPTILGNDIYGNSGYAVNNQTAFDIDARKNWWGPDGLTAIQTGANPKNLSFIYDRFDNSTYGMVNYAGWLTKPFIESDLTPPKFTVPPAVSNIAYTQATVQWQTDEAATSQVS